jgi:hypothetical protein
MGKGKRFELDTKNSINDATHEWVKAHRPDFSGNSVGEVADVMVVWEAQRYGDAPRHVAYVELKKRSGVEEGNRKVVMEGSSDGQSGVDELEELINESPSWSDTYVGVKFPNRELIVIDAEVLLHWLRREEEGWGQDFLAADHTVFEDDYQLCEQVGARLTRGHNISMVKPELDWWPSSQGGKDDHIKLLHGIGVEDYDIR